MNIQNTFLGDTLKIAVCVPGPEEDNCSLGYLRLNDISLMVHDEADMDLLKICCNTEGLIVSHVQEFENRTSTLLELCHQYDLANVNLSVIQSHAKMISKNEAQQKAELFLLLHKPWLVYQDIEKHIGFYFSEAEAFFFKEMGEANDKQLQESIAALKREQDEEDQRKIQAQKEASHREFANLEQHALDSELRNRI